MKLLYKESLIGCGFLQICLVLVLLNESDSNQFDPHVLPKYGPFFEGWYLRITESHSPVRFGLLFGHVIPEDASSVTPRVLATILYKTCLDGDCPLKSIDAFFNFSSVNITTKGHRVTKDPDDESPVNFEWVASSNSSMATFKVVNDSTYFDFKLNGARLSGKVGSHIPWGPHGEGPEGPFIEHLPLPLSWFVYSLRSQVVHYEFQDPTTGTVWTSDNAVVHLEKNWGKSFPKSWIWAQGTSDVAYVALSGGLVTIAMIDVPAYLIGYRNFAKNLSVNFQPLNSITVINHDGCRGYANLSVTSLSHKLILNMTTNINQLSDCLYGPMKNGFTCACVESYDASIEAVLFKRHLIDGFVEIDHQFISKTGLEFGGEYVCKNRCRPTGP
ncbi:uncharacterized protein LOC126815922 [Patella vulgata]|uniref:uncharacterized protein LOC126815922 n=1 Tax=Patella vulgata TaxID=6465 RepID=UPI0024A90ABA|nr:uncharacterized protein LOC126815922 [Patella vulgata]XP_050397984.2 uncharacterized protein LOC126815922 [Patella vulgata]XP_050397986.2 uncharacterized protein LOC126815922 [Patella vulgata]